MKYIVGLDLIYLQFLLDSKPKYSLAVSMYKKVKATAPAEMRCQSKGHFYTLRMD